MSAADIVDPRAKLYAELRAVTPGIPEEDLPRFAAAITVAEPYAPGVDAVRWPGVAPGELSEHRFVSRRFYPGVERAVRRYVPVAAQESAGFALAVFQDGARYLGPQAEAACVLDNLIACGAIPPTIALFVEPGETGPGLPIYGGSGNRSLEYDSLGDAYARFLIEELIPAFAGPWPLSGDPRLHAICGLSSGGFCAFNAAWERPDYFGRVVSHCGSFVDIRGGHLLPAAVRSVSAKPLRVFLQTGEHDLDVLFGNWILGNRALASALAYRGYDYQLVIGEGGHSLAHGGSTLGQTLRWLWRDWREAG
jgi:enterochelin esterase family protein